MGPRHRQVLGSVYYVTLSPAMFRISDLGGGISGATTTTRRGSTSQSRKSRNAEVRVF